jgi:ABC-2 type transport system permease protein
MLKYLIEKEFKQLRRNSFLPRMIIMFPLMILLFIPLAANFEVKNINLVIIDHDHSRLSGQLIQKVSSSGYFILSGMTENYDVAMKSIEMDRSDALLVIPSGFERKLLREHSADVNISANAVNGTKGALGSSYLSAIILDYTAELNSLGNKSGTGVMPSVEILPRYRFNPYLRYPVFMVPALMVMLLTMICGFLPALNIVGEKEKGTLEQINVTPVKRFTLILSKLIPYWIIGFVVLTLCFIIARVVYSLSPAGSLLTIYVFASVFILGISGFGLVISNYGKTLQQAMFMMFFFIITFIFLSGLYTPVSSMEQWAQYFSLFVPLRYMIEVLRQVYLKGSQFSDLLIQLLALSGFALFFNAWAILSYRKSE